jgi:hypothetical protein
MGPMIAVTRHFVFQPGEYQGTQLDSLSAGYTIRIRACERRMLSRNSPVAVTSTHGPRYPLYIRPEILILVLFFIRTS